MASASITHINNNLKTNFMIGKRASVEPHTTRRFSCAHKITSVVLNKKEAAKHDTSHAHKKSLR